MLIGLFVWPLMILGIPLLLIGGVGQGIALLFDKSPRYKCRNCGFIKTIPAQKH